MENRNELPLRLGVGIVVLNQKNEVFVGKRIDNTKNSRQMPQGGVDQKENFSLYYPHPSGYNHCLKIATLFGIFSPLLQLIYQLQQRFCHFQSEKTGFDLICFQYLAQSSFPEEKDRFLEETNTA